MDLLTNAEMQADKARDLPNFKSFSLPGIRQEASKLLGLIGRVKGIFSTYTFHDISHVDTMLKMLDWLIPSSTATVMTSVDWLMVVLSIYFHDLGMLVTSAEYEKRNENKKYMDWFDGLKKTIEGQEYLARTKRMSDEEREVFFFQEFIRMGHATRIREWITDRHSRIWGLEVKPISGAITKILEGLPIRFREHLGTVCESHHGENLYKEDLFPLCARYGSDQQEIANVQYAAILLRSTDLLHVTKDRTPSVAYQTLELSDPKAVSEWNKQLGTFSVGPKGRTLIEGKSESAVILINADFTEEPPLFALQEYIAYADSQIKKSKRWAEKSQEQVDAKDYSFPWHTVKGDVRLLGVPPQPLRFELDRGRLLDLLVGHTIYNEPTVAIRELLQNSIDAVRYNHYLDVRQAKTKGLIAPPIGKITVKWDSSARYLIVEDNGVGMDRDIINHHLMSVGTSFYDTPQFELENKDFTPISRFGIGILTCFMVSDDIEIVTVKDSKGYRIRMTSVKSDYLLRELEKDDLKLEGLVPHGTRITLRIRDTAKLPAGGVSDIIKYWVILPECSVEFVEDGKTPIKIGFDTPEEALRHWHQTSEDIGEQYSKIEFITKTRKMQLSGGNGNFYASYNMGFAVRSGFTPERSFVSKAEKEAPLPAVCIEGIRVSNSLPWFSQNISALLSVKGDRKLRTTVSRQGLEEDEHYDNMGNLCAEMLFGHVHDEIKRISGKVGNPLSQASTASLWLVNSLARVVASYKAKAYLNQLYEQLPSIVVERFKEIGGKPKTSRSMISYNNLLEEQEFWTIESRLVDSLGIISRDLGRELSLNEFLLALAPDFKNLHYSPLIPDAQLFTNVLYKTHRPERVEFSVQHQQAAVKWVRFKEDEFQGLLDEKVFNIDFLTMVKQKFYEEGRGKYYYLDSDEIPSLPKIKIKIAEIIGDDSNIEIVATRIGALIRPDSRVSNVLVSLIKAGKQLANEFGQIEMFVWIYKLVLCLSDGFMVQPHHRNFREIRGEWERYYELVHPKLNDLKIDCSIPKNINELRDVPTFNATSYWRDWFEPLG